MKLILYRIVDVWSWNIAIWSTNRIFGRKIYRIMWVYWNAFEVSNVSFFLDLSINYNVFFWHDLWNDVWIGWMVFCYENFLFEMLWWSMIEHIDFMMHYIDWFRYYMIICFIIETRIWNIIYEELWYKKHNNNLTM